MTLSSESMREEELDFWREDTESTEINMGIVMIMIYIYIMPRDILDYTKQSFSFLLSFDPG